MDEATMERILDRLVALGLVDQSGSDVRPSLRWHTKLQAAAEKINVLVAKTGTPIAGNPLVVAAAQALANENLDIPEAEFDEHVQILVLLELSRMTPAKRASHGFPDLLFPGEKKAQAGEGVDFL